MTARYYTVMAWVGPYCGVHLSLVPRTRDIWPHTLCNIEAVTDAPIASVPTCLICVGTAADFDQRLAEQAQEPT